MDADVAGYSRLMHNDEEATHAKVAALLIDAVTPAIAERGGRIVKNTGDGFLAEFPSAVEAVRAAVQFQARIRELTMNSEDSRIMFRVGINVGDVIIEPHDVFGDGVNIAARRESIAEAGGIWISSSAYDHVQGKIQAEFIDMGEQRASPGQAARMWVRAGCRNSSSVALIAYGEGVIDQFLEHEPGAGALVLRLRHQDVDHVELGIDAEIGAAAAVPFQFAD